ncbi:MAG: M23 family metallopeptidase [Verrucomicrobiota bacterium]
MGPVPFRPLCLEQTNLVLKRDSVQRLLWTLLLPFLLTGRTFGDASVGKASSCRETLIKISTEKGKTGTRLFVENIQAAEVTVTFEMDLVNLRADVKFPYTTTVAGKQKVELFRLAPIDDNRGWSWTYTYYSTFGSTTAEHDDTYVYTLPYTPGKAYRVSQGFNGEYSHFGSDQFAIDWRMGAGSPVHAARDGLVVGVKDDSGIGGDDSKYDWDANYILVQHPDGTLGQYVHLLKGGSKVKLGQHVEAGDLLGLSGNTGHSTGPHLHFSVFKARDGKHRQTIPIRYRTADDASVVLQEGKAYRASTRPALAAVPPPRSTHLPSIDHTLADGVGGESLAAHDVTAVGH